MTYTRQPGESVLECEKNKKNKLLEVFSHQRKFRSNIRIAGLLPGVGTVDNVRGKCIGKETNKAYSE